METNTFASTEADADTDTTLPKREVVSVSADDADAQRVVRLDGARAEHPRLTDAEIERRRQAVGYIGPAA